MFPQRAKIFHLKRPDFLLLIYEMDKSRMIYAEEVEKWDIFTTG
jgi:hypothetical protein